MLIFRRFRLDRSKAFRLLDELADSQGKAVTLYFPRGISEAGVEGLLRRVFTGVEMPPDVARIAASSKAGAAFFWSPRRIYLLLPPFPITEEYIADGYDIAPLCSLLRQDFLIVLILIRLGAYSIGVCRGTELIDSKTGTGLIHARHKKGGRSQARFARHREKQIEEFLERVCAHIWEHVEPYAQSLDYLVYGGSRAAILSLRKRCVFLSQFDDRVLRMLLDIPEPRKAVLEKAISTIWSTEVIEWHLEES